MIKKLFFTAALLVSGVVYAGSPSTNLSVQIVPTGSDPAVPVGAQTAGFTTLAFHSDFTQPFYSTLSNWLDCAGASNPLWFIAGGNGSPAPPCSRISMINDGGVQVLDMRFTSADAANLGTVLTTINAIGSNNNKGLDFPNGAYWQATYRVTPSSRDSNPFGTLISDWWLWSDTGQTGKSNSFMEWDFLETYGTGAGHEVSATHPWGSAVPSGQGGLLLAGFGKLEYPVDMTAYHTIAGRITQDGSTNASMCIYIDGVLQNCADFISAGDTGAKALTSSEFNQRNYAVLQLGPLNSTPVSATMDLLVKDVQIWTCPGWWGGTLNTPGSACNGTVLTGAP